MMQPSTTRGPVPIDTDTGAARRRLVAGVLAVAMAIACAAPAAAADRRWVSVLLSAVDCDATGGGYLVEWRVENPHDVSGTIGNVRPEPSGRSVEFPERLPAKETVFATLRLLHIDTGARLRFDVRWDDGRDDRDYLGQMYLKVPPRCEGADRRPH